MPRFSGSPEIWFNSDRNILVLRSNKITFEALYLEKPNQPWIFHAFKPMGSFDFFNGSEYLVKNNFKLVERL